MDDIDEVIRAAGDFRFQGPRGHLILNPLSSLPEPRRHLKAALKERVRALVGAYISLATFVEDEKAFEPNRETYQRVLKNMDQYENEIEAFLRELAN